MTFPIINYTQTVLGRHFRFSKKTINSLADLKTEKITLQPADISTWQPIVNWRIWRQKKPFSTGGFGANNNHFNWRIFQELILIPTCSAPPPPPRRMEPRREKISPPFPRLGWALAYFFFAVFLSIFPSLSLFFVFSLFLSFVFPSCTFQLSPFLLWFSFPISLSLSLSFSPCLSPVLEISVYCHFLSLFLTVFFLTFSLCRLSSFLLLKLLTVYFGCCFFSGHFFLFPSFHFFLFPSFHFLRFSLHIYTTQLFFIVSLFSSPPPLVQFFPFLSCFLYLPFSLFFLFSFPPFLRFSLLFFSLRFFSLLSPLSLSTFLSLFSLSLSFFPVQDASRLLSLSLQAGKTIVNIGNKKQKTITITILPPYSQI